MRRTAHAVSAAMAMMLGACGALGACSDDTSRDGASSTVTAAEFAPLEGELEAGTETYEVRLPDRTSPRFAVTVTLPAGWSGLDGWVLRRNGGVDSREGIAVALWGAPAFVYGDPCRWADSAVEVEPTVEFMAEALAAQATRDASTPREFVAGEHSGTELELSVPDDADIARCDVYEGTPYFQSWASADGQTARYHQGPGQRDRIRLVDVDGDLLIIDTATWPELPPDLEAELLTVLDSMRFATIQP
jgi:hypothetical protein